MFTQMAEAQADVVNALLDGVDRDDWARAFAHAEFGGQDSPLPQLRRGFLIVPSGAGWGRAPLLLDTPVGEALDALRLLYSEAGQGFWRLDLTVEPDGRYRFEFDDAPSLLCAGQPDPEARERIEARFRDLARELG